MPQQKKQLVQDIVFIILSVAIAILVVWSGVAEEVVLSLGSLKWFGIIIAGMFFTSVFTTAPSIAILGTFAETTPLTTLVPLGALGALIGDYIIFKFMQSRISGDLEYVMSHGRGFRLPAIFKTRLFKFFIPFIGALVIASPLPDEIGIAMIGLSHVRDRVFVVISLVFNALGILVIGLIAQTIAL